MKKIHDENKIKEMTESYCRYFDFEYDSEQAIEHKKDMKEYAEHIREKTIDECIACVPEVKDIGYEKGQEQPNIQDETLADFYDTKAEAFFAGCDETVKNTITNLNNLKNNEQ